MSAALDMDDPRHGTTTGYGLGCRCLDCSAARRDYERRRRANANIQPGDNDPRHGTTNGYGLGCRCDTCKTASSEYQKRWSSTRPQRSRPKRTPAPRPPAPAPLPVADGHHGRPTGYRIGCRCDDCRAAKRAETAAVRANREARALPPGDPRHGTPNGYTNWRCRCDRCRAAHTAEQRATPRAAVRAARPAESPDNDARVRYQQAIMMNTGGTCPRCRAGVLSNGEHLRDDLPPCYGVALPTRPGSL